MKTILNAEIKYNLLPSYKVNLFRRGIYEIYIKIKINLNFYFATSLWCLKMFCEGL